MDLSKTRRLVAVGCALMFAYGCFLGASQAVIERVGGSLGLDLAGIGALVSLQFLPAAFVPVWMGRVSDRVGRKPVLAAFCALFAVGLVICGSARVTAVYAVGAVAIGASYSVCESGVCAVMADLGPEWNARGVNLSQALLCLGAVLAPALIAASGIAWRTVYCLCAALFALLAPVLLATRFPPPRAAEAVDRSGLKVLLRSAAFLCLFAGIIFYVGIATGFGYFIESLISGRFRQTAVSCVSLYWLGMMLSRFVFSSIRYRAKPVLVGGFAVIAALFLALTLSAPAAVSLALCFATGFAYGPIWSTLVSEATARHPQYAGEASGLMSAGCGAGGILFPALTGLAARHVGLTTAFALLGGVALLGCGMCALLPNEKR